MNDFRIEEGKRYKTRNGYITGPIEAFVVHQLTYLGTFKQVHFTAEINDEEHHANGIPSKLIWIGNSGRYLSLDLENRYDLIEEYIEEKE